MRLFLLIVFLFSFLVFETTGQIIHIPADYPTIQEGVNAAAEGDTVLVAPGTYFENISLNGTNITLASHFLVTNDTSYISLTIIDGELNGSVITIENEEDPTTRICGFSITHGGGVYSGGGLYIDNADPSLEYLYIYENHAAGGGGLYIGTSSSTIDHVRIINNYCEKIGNWYVGGGGGLLLQNSGDGNVTIKNSLIAGNSSIADGGGIHCSYALLELENTDIIGNIAQYGGGIYSGGNFLAMDPVNRCNIYSNTAFVGNDLYNPGSPDIQVIVDTFTVLIPTNFHVGDTSHFQFDIQNGKLAQVNADLYVAPSGDDESSGLSPDNPLKTIHTAISKMLPFSGDTNTFFLAAGTYSPSATNEFFPVVLPDYINLEGNDAATTILDAESMGQVIRIYGNSFNEISAMTLTGGVSEEGGGVYCRSENTTLKDLNIIGNAAINGGGIFTDFCEPVIRDCNIQGNSVTGQGGGIYMMTDPDYFHSPRLTDLLIKENHAAYGGGIAVDSYIMPVFKGITVCYNTAEKGGGIYGISDLWPHPAFDTLDRCNIYLNSALYGNDLYPGGHIDVVVDTFTVMTPTEFHANPLFYCAFDILNSKLTQVEADLFISPSGSNSNSGLTADDPLKTIHHALTIILATKDEQRQIHLLDGTYSPTMNGEFFPIYLTDYVHLSGTADSLVILDAESTAGVLQIISNDTNHVSDLTLTGGSTSRGAGLYIMYSDPELERLIISGNTSTYLGGGLYCELSNPLMNEISITGNLSNSSGGGIYLQQSSPALNHVIISQNTASSGGGVNVASSSNPVFEDVMISENEALSGAGICNYGRLELLDCEVSGNTGTSKGGGIYTSDSIWLVNTVVKENAAESGGGLYASSNSSARLDAVELSENTASNQGGGLCCEGGANTWLSQVKVTDNISTRYGGGIYCLSNSNLFLSGSTISYNHSDYAGGGIMWSSYISTHFDSTDRCNIYLNSAGSGNDLFSSSSYDTVDIIVDTFTVMYPTEYHAEYKDKFNFDILAGKLEQADADLYVSPSGDDANTGLTTNDPLKTIDRAFQKLRSDINHQYTVHLANGVYSPSATGEKYPVRLVNYSSLSGESRTYTFLDAEGTAEVLAMYYDTIAGIENMTITGGKADYRGGGIECIYSSVHFNNLKLTGNTVAENEFDSDGGGIYISSCDNVILSNVIIEDNSANYGGGIYANYKNLDLYNVEFINNNATYGGGLYLELLDTVLMDHLKFIANTATEAGGGIFGGGEYYNYGSRYLSIINTTIDANHAKQGGGIWMKNSSPFIQNSLITNNTASMYAGGVGLHNDYDDPFIQAARFCNVTFANNTNLGLASYSAGIRLVNSIFWGNSGSYQILYGETGSQKDTLQVMNSDIMGGLDGIAIGGSPVIESPPGNINEDPLFLLSGDYPYSLDEGSPCIDAGTPDTSGLYLPYNDIIGNTRVWDGDGDGVPVIDMGPYEFGAPVDVPDDGHLKDPYSGDIYIYPNPASDHLTIGNLNNQTDRTVIFINNTGQVVHSLMIQAGREKVVINLNHFSQGLYTVLFSDENGVFAVKKVVVIN